MRLVYCLAAAVLVGCASSKPKKPEAPLAMTFDNIVEIQKAGYKVVNENGKKLYCREHTHTGSRVRKSNVCYTEEQLLAAGRNAQDQMQDATRVLRTPACNSSGPC